MRTPRRRSFRPTLSALEGRQLLSGTALSAPIQFDFGPQGQVVGAGTTSVTPFTNYSAAQGYGFTKLGPGSNALDHPVAGTTDVTRDAVYSPDMVFQVDLPNGVYTVTPTLGEAGGSAHAAAVLVQGTLEANVATAANANASPSYIATVTDGHLTLELQGTGPDGLAMIEGLTIAPVTLQFDFGPQGQVVGAGTTSVTPFTNYSAAQGYGFTKLGPGSNALDHPVAGTTDVTRDAVYSPDMVFQVDLPNGVYTVTPTLGEAGGSAHTADVLLQGTEIASVSTAANANASPSYTAVVLDGHLTLELQGTGLDQLAMIEGLTISPATSFTVDNLINRNAVSESGQAWGKASGYGGFGNEIDFAPAGNGSTTKSWQVPGLTSGRYDVEVTWLAGSNRATNAPYQIYDGNNLIATVTVNQQQAPLGLTYDGVAFQSLGTFNITSGNLRVVLTNNANGFVIADAVHVAAPVTPPVTLDNSGSSFTESGPWTAASGYGGYNGEIDFVAPGNGSATASWQTPGLSPGLYDVQVTWLAGSNRATNAPYQIYDGNTLITTVTVNQQKSPTGTNVDGVAFQSLGTYNITSGTVRVVLANNANGYVIADAARVTLPTISTDNNVGPNFSESGFWTQASGYGGVGNEVDFAAPGDGSITATWTNSNLAASDYDVQVTWMAGTNRATNAPYQVYDGNTLLATVTVNQQQAPLGVSVGGVTYQSLGVYHINSGTLRVVLGNNANGYVIADAARVTAPTLGPVILDNSGTSFAESGPWTAASGYGGYGGEVDYAATGDGSTAATWQTLGMQPGKYDVQATWLAGSNRATNASYQIYDGNTLVATVPVNQTSAPSGVTVGGVTFQSLGLYQFTSGSIRVVLSNNANGYVIADAIRLAPVVTV